MSETQEADGRQTADHYTKRRVLESMENAIRAIGSCRKSSTRNGTPDPEHVQQLRDAIADYHAALEAHRHEKELEDVWEDTTDISELFDTPVTTETETPGYDGGTQEDTVNAIATLGFQELKAIVNELHEIRSQMGIKPNITSQHVAEIDDELIEEVEEWRTQNLED